MPPRLFAKSQLWIETHARRCGIQPKGPLVVELVQCSHHQLSFDTTPAISRVDEHHGNPTETALVAECGHAADDVTGRVRRHEAATRVQREKQFPVARDLVPAACATEQQAGLDVARLHETDRLATDRRACSWKAPAAQQSRILYHRIILIWSCCHCIADCGAMSNNQVPGRQVRTHAQWTLWFCITKRIDMTA